jgi:hypothetical protein
VSQDSSAPVRKFAGGCPANLRTPRLSGRATARLASAGRSGPVPARCPVAAGRDGGLRLGSRRAGCTPGRCDPVRRCVIPAAGVSAGMIPPPTRAAMLAAATRSRCPRCPQCGQLNTRPAGLGTRRAHDGQVEDVPRSSTSRTAIPAAAALSRKTAIRWPSRQSRVRWLCRCPAGRPRTPRGSPTARVPARCATAQFTTVLAASCWACRTRRACRASAARWRRRCARHRRDHRCPGFGARRAAARLRPLRSRRCCRHSARTARPDTTSPCPSGPATAYGWMMPRSTPATRPGSGSSPSEYTATATSAVTSKYRRPAATPSVTDRTCPVGYGMSRSRRSRSGGHPLAAGICTTRPVSPNLPAYQRTGTRPRRRRGNRAL